MMNNSNKEYKPVFTLLLLNLLSLPTAAWAMESHDTAEEETILTAEQFDFSNLETTPDALKELFQQIVANSPVAAGVHAAPLDDTSLEHLLEQDDYYHDLLVPAVAPALTPNPVAYNTSLLAVAPSSEPTLPSHSVTPDTHSSTSCIIDMASKHSVASRPEPNKHSRVDDNAPKKFVCDSAGCGYRTNKNSNLKQHMLVHKRQKPFKCDECGTLFTHMCNLKRHQKQTRHHPLRAANPDNEDESHNFLVPAVAPAPAPNPLGYNTNLLPVAPSSEPTETSHSVTPARYSSTSCIIDDDDDEEDSTFEDTEPTADPVTHAVAMASKHSVATQPRPNKRRRTLYPASKEFVCNVENCGYRTNKNSDLKKHMVTHTAEKYFQCVQCGKRFSQNGNLKRHIHAHTQKKLYECKECHTAFDLNRTLRTHMRSHTGEKLFHCEQCGAVFAQKYNVARHKRRYHPLIPAKPDHAVEEDSLDTHEEHDDE